MRSISLFITILEFLAEFMDNFVIDNGAYCVNDIIARKIVAWSESGCAGWFFVLFAKAKTPLIQLLCLSSIIILPLEQSKNEHHSFCIYWWEIIKLYRYAKKYERVCNVITGNTSFFLKNYEGTLVVSVGRFSGKGERTSSEGKLLSGRFWGRTSENGTGCWWCGEQRSVMIPCGQP